MGLSIYFRRKEAGWDGTEPNAYGKAGERRSLTYPDGRTVSYGYDEEIRLS